MKQMQDELLSKARWDGGWPRAVPRFPGLVALAHNEEQLRAFQRQDMVLAHVFVAVMFVVTAAGIACLLLD